VNSCGDSPYAHQGQAGLGAGDLRAGGRGDCTRRLAMAAAQAPKAAPKRVSMFA
jgi:hypothetical protein